jgi:hypothetical protein
LVAILISGLPAQTPADATVSVSRRVGQRLHALPGGSSGANTGGVEGESVREFIDRLSAAAADSPGGLDGPVELAICDGRDLQFIDRVDVSAWATVGETARLRSYVLIRAHHHPGERPGPLTHGAAVDADEELRRLTEGDNG